MILKNHCELIFKTFLNETLILEFAASNLLGIIVEFLSLTKQNMAQRFYLENELVLMSFCSSFLLGPKQCFTTVAIVVEFHVPVREASRDLWLKAHILSQVLSSESSFCWPSCWRPKRGSYRKHFTRSSECSHPSGEGWHPHPSLSLWYPQLLAGEASGCLVQNQTYSPAFTCLSSALFLLLSLPIHSFFHAFIQQIVELLTGSTGFL